MANYDGSLEAVDCHIHSVRYDMAVNRGTCGISDVLIRSPTTVRYDMAVNRGTCGISDVLIRTPTTL
eukprot:scaffold8580_cov114-Skeletonema_dohrnii-CCMP3373.AAC.1